MDSMKSIPDTNTTPDEKMQHFEIGLRQALNCSKAQLKSALEYEKQANTGKPKRGPKPSASGHASRDKD
jgi:hypothetical protein